MPYLAIILGGAECVWNDFAAARALCAEAQLTPTLFLTNDMIEQCSEDGVGVTLHPDKLTNWMAKRRMSGYPALAQIWAHRAHRQVQRDTKDWGGSVGLFASKIAHWELNYEKAILCGVPMMTNANHFVRHKSWNACTAFKTSWVKHMPELKPWLRSMSGWTAEQLGKPDLAWLVPLPLPVAEQEQAAPPVIVAPLPAVKPRRIGFIFASRSL